MSRYLPQALGATGLVIAGPIVAVWALRAWQVVGSTPVAVVLGFILSLGVSFGGSAYWANRESSRDVLFSELMIWGWLRRWRAEHKLTAALDRLGRLTAPNAAREATPQLSMLKELAMALEAGDPYTRNHSRRVARYASMIAERLGLSTEDVDRIRTAAMLHDVGKVRTPIEVLHKPGRLTDEEYEIIKAHPVDGARLVEALADERLTAIVRHHHERLDGRGYPDGLRGEEIPLGARIISVADTFDAITSARAYRPASPHRKALDILIKEAGTQLDADAVRAFRACYTGRRPFALWMTLLAFPQRVTSSLGNGTTATAVSFTKVVATASTVAVVGGAAASAPSLMVVSSLPRVTRVASASEAAPSSSHASAAPLAVNAHFTPAAVGAKLSAPPVRTREQTLMRRARAVSHRFPTVPASHAATPPPPSSQAAATPVSTSVPSAPAAAPAPSAVPASTAPPAPVGPVSTVTNAPAATHGSGPGSGSKPGSGSGSGSDKGKGTTGAAAKGHGHGDGQGKGKRKGKGTGTTPTTDPTRPTTTTPVANPPGNGNGNAGGNGRGNAGAKGTGNPGGDGTGGAGTSNPGGNGTGNGNGAGDAGGSTTGTGNGGGSTTATGNGGGSASGTSNTGGNATGAGTGTGNGTGNAGGNGTGAGGTGGTGTSNGNGTGGTGTSNGNGNSGGTGHGNGASLTISFA